MIAGGGLMTNTFPDCRVKPVHVTYKAVDVDWLAITIYFLIMSSSRYPMLMPSTTYLAVL
jgi:hypothetical protein